MVITRCRTKNLTNHQPPTISNIEGVRNLDRGVGTESVQEEAVYQQQHPE